MPLIIKIELEDEKYCQVGTASLVKKRCVFLKKTAVGIVECCCPNIESTPIYGPYSKKEPFGTVLRPQACIDAHSRYHKKAIGEVLEQFDRFKSNCAECNEAATCFSCGSSDVKLARDDVCAAFKLICREKLLEAADEADN